MYQIPFAITAVVLWALFIGVTELLNSRRPPAQDEEPFDMTNKMSKSRQYGRNLLALGLLAIAITFGVWCCAGWV